MASLLEQLEAGDAADDEERAADARFARMLQRMKDGGGGAEREASLQSEIDALSAAEASRTGGSHTAPLTHTVIPPAQRVVHTSYRLAEGCIVRKKEVFFNYFIGRNTFYFA